MLAASFLAIFLIPALFYVVEKIGGEKQHAKPAASPLEPAVPATATVHQP
jgi:hypothetical protein